MTVHADARRQLLQVLVELARELPPETLKALTSALEHDGDQDLGRFAITPSMREKVRRLGRLLIQQPELGGHAIALALLASGRTAAALAEDHDLQIAWTGPGTEAVPLRRVDQVVYDLVESAVSDITLVSYAAYKAERALEVLRMATARDVRVKLIIELAQESGGKITFDDLSTIRQRLPLAQVFYWALDRRPRDVSGSYGAMHAKCLIADRNRAMVSSANLTGYALETNMELGLVVKGSAAARLAEHFDQLILRGELVSAP